MVRAFTRNENTFLSDQSQSSVQSIYSGQFGDDMRQLLVLETKLVEERRALERQKVASGIFGAVAGGLAVHAGNKGDTITQMNMTQLMTDAFGEIGEIDSISVNLQDRFEVAMSEVYGSSFVHYAQLMAGEQSVQVHSLDQLRALQRELLNREFADPAPLDSGICRVSTKEEVETQGHFSGHCAMGLASGHGLFSTSGLVVLGNFSNGLIDGRATVLKAAGDGLFEASEGDYREGQPVGIHRVARPDEKAVYIKHEVGKPPKRASRKEVRTFLASVESANG